MKKWSNDDHDYCLKIGAFISNFDYKTGLVVLIGHNVIWNEKFGINCIDETRKDHPLKVNGNTKRVSRDEGDFIRFSGSDDITDSAQTAVPFWDGQPVTPIPAVPLTGFAFIWRSIHNSGGFVAPAVVPYNKELYINATDFEAISLLIKKYRS